MTSRFWRQCLLMIQRAHTRYLPCKARHFLFETQYPELLFAAFHDFYDLALMCTDCTARWVLMFVRMHSPNAPRIPRCFSGLQAHWLSQRRISIAEHAALRKGHPWRRFGSRTDAFDGPYSDSRQSHVPFHHLRFWLGQIAKTFQVPKWAKNSRCGGKMQRANAGNMYGLLGTTYPLLVSLLLCDVHGLLPA